MAEANEQAQAAVAAQALAAQAVGLRPSIAPARAAAPPTALRAGGLRTAPLPG